MSILFPINDLYWSQTLSFLKSSVKSTDKILAPSEFSEVLPSVVFYHKSVKGNLDDNIWWFVIHKGMIDSLEYPIIEKIRNGDYLPVFANEVFVILCNKTDTKSLSLDSSHVKSLFEKLVSVREANINTDKNIREKSVLGISTDFSLLPIHQFSELSRSQIELNSRRLCQTTYLGDSTILCRVLGRYMCYVEARDASLTPHLCLNGYWESWLTQVMVSFVQPGFYCLDVGANCGYYSLIMADIVGESGHVLSVEPNPRLSSLLAKSLNVNGFTNRTEVSSKAVSDLNGDKVNLVIPTGDFWGSATICGESETESLENTFEVETVTIDDLTKDYPRVDFIKIDAEGAELSIWKGMQKTIEKNTDISIILEFSSLRNYDAKPFLEDIQSQGFVIRYIDSDATLKDLSIEECLNQDTRTYWDLFLQRKTK